MFAPSLIALLSFVYIGILFLIAIRGDRQKASERWQPVIYALSISTVCTSWSFYGAIEQFHATGWWLAPLHIGISITLIFGWRFMQRMIDVARQENSTTIADFIGARYGHSRTVAMLVVVISLVGITPYIALQYKAVSASFDIMTRGSDNAWHLDLALMTALIMAAFSIIFGTRNMDTSEKHHGLMHTLAFEGIFKLSMLLGVGIYVIWGLFDGPMALIQSGLDDPAIRQRLTESQGSYVYIANILLGMTIIFALPRQFHVAVVENSTGRDMKTARWMFPLYLFLINILVQPLAIAGNLLLGNDHPDTAYFSLLIPMSQGADWLAVMVYLGGISAATSMVIIATVTLSTMVSNEMILPMAFKMRWISSGPELNSRVLWIRRLGILIISLGAYVYYRYFTSDGILVSIGMPALIAVAQFAPAMVLGVSWSALNRRGAVLGLSAGFFVWFYTLVLPVIIRSGFLPENWLQGPLGWDWAAPQRLFGIQGIDPTVHGLFWSLMVNVIFLVVGSFYYRERLSDLVQANRFVHPEPLSPVQKNRVSEPVAIQDLKIMLDGLLGPEKTADLFKVNQIPHTGRLTGQMANESLLEQSERLLGSVIGASAARIMLESLKTASEYQLGSLSSMVEEATKVSTFGRELLNSAVQSISQGISIVDRDQNLVAWNLKFQELFRFPDDMLEVGKPIEGLIRVNAERGEMGEGDIDYLVQRRLDYLRSGRPHRNERKLKNGRYIELIGSPMPGGNYITTYNDITDQKLTEQQLKQSNESLEKQVLDRTSLLEKLNRELTRTNENKTHYLAAVGHDLVQPLNSAQLFTASVQSRLKQQNTDQEIQNLVENVQASIDSAGNLLSGLLDYSKLDAELIHPEPRAFYLKDWLDNLVREFIPLADQEKLELVLHNMDVWVNTDPVLLKRILQNLLVNALRYTEKGRVLVAVRRRQQKICIEVRDSGKGIPEQSQELIFKEFQRLHNKGTSGLGLGLAIVQRLCHLQAIPLSLRSAPDKGSVFSVCISQAEAVAVKHIKERKPVSYAKQASILCIDNESSILEGMNSLLTGWGFEVSLAADRKQAETCCRNAPPDIVLVDYHLDNETGVELIDYLRESQGLELPGIVITANYSDRVSDEASNHQLKLLKKPVKPLALRSLIDSILTGL